MNFLYLLVDLGAIAVPLLFSFHPKIQLYKRWHLLWPSILLSLVPFVIWDSYFTKIRVWGFTPKYLTGIYFFDLPVEEILFFICIPYACLFTYYCFRIYFGADYRVKRENNITAIFLCFTFAMGLTYFDRYYTCWTAVGLFGFLLFLKLVVKAKWLSLFYFSHMFLLIPFFIVNGILTGSGLDEPVVWYNNAENIGIRIFTIPFEDIFYGMLMLLLNTFLFEYLLAKYPVPEKEKLETVSVR
ncbi:lycopene cyclase domain-containing protein [Dyadobacter sp. LJ53]|uniref:lycopene cyclase domain-containing protein n=1 Tax=Dyadobacter chenwenxiniae TaxID=2906456 RepID=UPI001F206285|nr:lycopene cyclase domain-containing protein [Dyadobacter chenwenxiniae]MCF0048860.1 lycopene cyclase domain-containing protein [Dyadobacter chenwenxiniae]